MSRSSVVANSLLRANLPSSEIADIVFKHATSKSEVRMPTPITATLARNSRGLPWGAAVTIAYSATDPRVLDKLARDSRKQVRRAVAENPNISVEAATYLYVWAVKNNDRETLRGAIAHVSLDHVLNNWDDLKTSGYPLLELAARFTKSENPSHLENALEKAGTSLLRNIASNLTWGQCSHMSLTEFLEKQLASSDDDSEVDVKAALVVALRHAGKADRELCELLVRFAPAMYRNEVLPNSITEDGIDVLLASDNSELHLVSARVVELPRQIDKIIDLTTDSKDADRILATLIDMRLAHLSTAQLERVTDAFAKIENPRIAGAVGLRFFKLRSSQVDDYPAISSKLVCTLYKHTRGAYAKEWLQGLHIHQPQPGDITEFLATHARFQSLETLARGLGSSVIDATVTRPWADELFNGLGTSAFEALARSNLGAEYLVRRVVARIGVNPSAWELMYSLLSNFEGSIETLLDTTHSLMVSSGIEIDIPETPDHSPE